MRMGVIAKGLLRARVWGALREDGSAGPASGTYGLRKYESTQLLPGLIQSLRPESSRPAGHSNGAQASHKRNQILSILFPNSGELQPHSLPFPGMPNRRVGSDGTFLHQKMQVRLRANLLRISRFDEHSADAHIADACDIVPAVASPVDPDMLW